jgi:YD repeat-containing protein
MRDEDGGRAQFDYCARGELSGVRITDRCGRTWRLSYDAHGFLSKFEDPSDRVTRLEHDAEGKLLSVTSPAGVVTTPTWDDQGRLSDILNQSGRTHMVYGGPVLLRATTPDGVVRVSPRRHKLTIRFTRSDGWWEKLTLDRYFSVVRRESAAGSVDYVRHDSGVSGYFRTKAGTLNIEQDTSGLNVTTTFQAS